jgi:diguanylate cyclase (GGDEF)-like protein/putative nucleotidyltransferase with HDIG domain
VRQQDSSSELGFQKGHGDVSSREHGVPVAPYQNARLEPIKTRAPARFAVGTLVVMIAAIGMWGAVSSARGLDSYRHAKRFDSAIEQARYSLALERSALHDLQRARARAQVTAAASGFEAQMRLAAQSGEPDAAEQAARLTRQHTALLATESAALGASNASTALSSRAAESSQAAALDAALARTLSDVRQSGAELWPSTPIQKAQLGAVLVLVALGLASAAVLLLRLAGYRRRQMRARRDKLQQLERDALSDNLTGLGNHRAFYEDLKREISRRARTGSCFSVVMLDLDDLKQINDSLGHQAGDERIRGVAECLRATLRASDGAYRTGGDEFMALLPDERAWGGLTFAQRLQAEISKHPKPLAVSCGVVESAGLESADSLVHRADLAQYEAKRTGRRIVVYSDGLGPRPTDRPEDLAARRHHRLLATALAQAVDAKDVGTRNHCETVSALCVLVGQALGLGGERLEQLRLAGLLHDVGKIGIADALLQKPRALEPDERRAMSGHVEIGYEIVSAAGLEEEARWILHHHEHVDGSGYPAGLAGTMIPLESRIILVADAFEAMTADRPYRAARKPAEALDELERRAGTQFDAACVEALRAVLDSEGAKHPLELAAETGLGESVWAMAPYTGPKVEPPSHRQRESQ